MGLIVLQLFLPSSFMRLLFAWMYMAIALGMLAWNADARAALFGLFRRQRDAEREG